jgi:hypothetical protein
VGDVHLTEKGASAANGWLRVVATQVLILLVTLAAAEIILRVIDLRYLRMDESGTQPVYAHDDELGWFPIPNSAQTYTGSRTVQVRHNSLGLRDVELETTDKPTIAFLGDSFVWGYDAEQGERFTDLLRGMMPDYRIANLGVNAYGTDQEFLVLRRLWDRVTPSVVVLMVCVDNDRIENSTNLRYDGPYKPYFSLADETFGGQPVPWSRHLYFGHYWIARHSWVVRVAISAYVYWKDPPLRLADPTERLIAMMRGMVALKGGRFLIGLERHDQHYERFFKAGQIPYVTFEDAEAYPTHGNHWTPKGNAFVAERMKQFLAANGIGAP